MCGITGFYSKTDKGLANHNLVNSANSFQHRGPDSEGYYFKTQNGHEKISNSFSDIQNTDALKIGIGFKRLSILDVENGSQPFASEDGRYTAVFNGEIYNFIELKSELTEWDFKSSSDGEIIIPMFIKYGINFAKKLNGMFAICIYDSKEDRIILIRDQVGIKPLYIYEDSNLFAFSSEIKSLLSFGLVKKEINYESVYDYLTFQNIFGTKTLFRNISLMPKGSIYIFQSKRLEKTKYWTYSDQNLENQYSKDDLIDRLRTAVNRQLVSDVPIGTYLSSGIDTSTITSLANETNQKFSSITCGYENNQSNPEFGLDEKALAKITSQKLGIEHFTYLLKRPSLSDTLYKTIYHLDEPKMGYSYQNLIISNATSQHFKVVLSGVGSDELFGGYPWRYGFVSKNKIDKDKHYDWWCRVVSSEETNEAFIKNSNFDNNYLARDSYENELSKSKQSNALSTIFAFEFNTFLQGLLVVEDKLSMANSLESRVPFLDIDLVNYVIGIDPNLKFTKDNGKLLLKDAIKNLVPDNVLKNPKVGFIPPVEYWNDENNKNFINQLLSAQKVDDYGVFNMQYIDKLKKQIFDEDYSVARKFWSVISFQAWLDIYFGDNLNHESFYNFSYNKAYEREQ